MASRNSTTAKTPNYYTTLNLASRKYDPTLTPAEVKTAYKRALLQHHPDKKTSSASTPPSSQSSRPNNRPNITIDSIALAYKILSSPSLKAEYDLALQTSRRSRNNNNNNNTVNTSNSDSDSEDEEESDEIFRTGLETVDLDDLEFVERSDNSKSEEETWTRACRCGDDGGFVVTEKELEANAEDGEVIVGCRGCSLWLRVLFGVEG